MNIISGLWLISRLSPVVQAVSIWAHAAMPVVATLLSMVVLLWAGSRPTQLLFHAARERMTAQNPPAIGTTLGICAIPVVALCMQCTWVLCCRVQCCMLFYVLHSHCKPYALPYQTGCTPVNTTTTKYTIN